MPNPAEQSRSWIQTQYSSFNGLRGLAVLLVFVCHYGPYAFLDTITRQLWFGVDVFFVLSGFLITGILFDSRNEPFYFRNFYIRRALRIFPLYYGLLLLLVLLHFAGVALVRRDFLWINLFYAMNFFKTHPQVRDPSIFLLKWRAGLIKVTVSPLWSLCVEEHFYLLWPFALRALGNRRAMMWFCALSVPVTIVFRCWLYKHNPQQAIATANIYSLTPARWDTLFVGAWLALWLRWVRLTRTQLRRLGTSVCIACVGLIVVGEKLTPDRPNDFDLFMNTIGFSVVALAAAGLLLLTLDETHPISRLLRVRFLAALGVVSYGFYLIHDLFLEPLLWYTRGHDWGKHRFLAASLVVLFCTVALAKLSFRFYESPFLKLKERLAPGHKSIPSGREVVVG